MRRSVISLIVATALIATLAPAAEAHRVSSNERSLLRRINRARTAEGLKPLTFDHRLSSFARTHSQAMANRNRKFHSSRRQQDRYGGCCWKVIGENIGFATTLDGAHPADSAKRGNVLCTCFTRVGTGVVVFRGRFWVTEIFYG